MSGLVAATRVGMAEIEITVCWVGRNVVGRLCMVYGWTEVN